MLIKPGDYVEVKEGVHDDRMPKGRRDGLVVEILGQDGWNRDPDQVLVMFHNNSFLKFHKSQLNLLKKIEVFNENR